MSTFFFFPHHSIDFSSCLLSMNKRTNVSITHPVLLCSDLITSFCCSIRWPLYTAVFHSITSLSLSLSSFILIGLLLYTDAWMMEMLVIMTFIDIILDQLCCSHIDVFIYKYKPTKSAQFYLKQPVVSTNLRHRS